jgi:predicted XRE-type DNA-binding protein
MKKTSDKVGSGNVFAEIARPKDKNHVVKAQLIHRIDSLMKARHLRVVDAAKLLGVTQSDVCQMLHGYFRQFSVERLMRFLVALGQDVEIVVTPHRGSRNVAHLRVTDGAGGPGGRQFNWCSAVTAAPRSPSVSPPARAESSSSARPTI